jgi:CPA2 family monovalent cation:H+ antiporter-2
MYDILLQATIYLAAAVVAVPISVRLGFGSVLGYLAAGLAIGPIFGLVGSETEDLRHFAEYGVVLMLFLIGLELRPKALWDMRTRLFGLGGLQVGVTLAAVALIALALGQPWREAVAIGIVLCLSSTAIVMQTLHEKKLARSDGGRAAFATLLFQDIAVIPLLAVVPLLAVGGGAPPPAVEDAPEAVRDLAGGVKALVVVGVVAAVILGGRFLTHPLFRFIAMARLPEIQTAAALLFVAAISLALGALNLSPALGSFLAGVVLANSEYRHALESDLAPFKGLLLGLFFITVGAGVDLGLLLDEPARLVGLTLLLMLLKMAILFPLAGAFGLSGEQRLLFTLALAQAGEFGFVLLAFAGQTGALPGEVTAALLLVVSLSMAFTPALFIAHDRLLPWFRRGPARPQDEIDEQGAVIIAGMGRFGQVVNRMLTGLGHRTVVLDSHPDTVDRVRAFGIKGFYGELDRPELLEAAGIAQARAVVLAIDDPEKVVKMTAQIRRRHPQVKIIARARDRHHVYQLYAAGTPHSVRELFDSAVRAGKYALEALGYDEEEIERIARAFVEHDRHMLAELAELWDPDTPPERNPAYMARARAQNAEIEAALRGELDR